MSFEIYSFSGRIAKERPKLFKFLLGVSVLAMILFLIYFIMFKQNYRGLHRKHDMRLVIGPPEKKIRVFGSALRVFSEKKWRVLRTQWSRHEGIPYLSVLVKTREETPRDEEYYFEHIKSIYKEHLAGFNGRIIVRRKGVKVAIINIPIEEYDILKRGKEPEE